jgi:hypothetical protein
MMRPRILVSRRDFDNDTELEDTQALQLYEAMFPEVERDDIEDIKNWVLRSDIGQERKFRINDGTELAYKLDSRYFVLSVARRAIGFGFFTYDYASNLIYGNYIAVQESWRDGDIASYFLDEITKILDELFPANQGTVFEVEKCDKARIEAIIAYVGQHGNFESDDDRHEIQKFLRITWYQRRDCRFFIDNDTREPLICTSPCLDPTESNWEDLEEDYWMMWRPKPNSLSDFYNAGALWTRTVNCIYVEILMKSLAESYPECGAKYRNYVTGVVDRTLAATGPKNITLGGFLHRSKSDLLKKWLALQIPLSI